MPPSTASGGKNELDSGAIQAARSPASCASRTRPNAAERWAASAPAESSTRRPDSPARLQTCALVDAALARTDAGATRASRAALTESVYSEQKPKIQCSLYINVGAPG